MKEQILQWLKFDRSYPKGVALYQQYGKSLSLKAILNRQVENPHNRNLLIEELRKLAGLDRDEIKHILSLPIQNQPEVPVQEVEKKEPEPEFALAVPVEPDKKKASPSASGKGSGSGKSSRS